VLQLNLVRLYLITFKPSILTKVTVVSLSSSQIAITRISQYDTIYQQRLGPFSRRDVEPFQFLEVGFFNGGGYDTYREFLPRGVSQ